MKLKPFIIVLFFILMGLISGCSSKSEKESKIEPQQVQETVEIEDTEYFEPGPLDKAWSNQVEREIEKLSDVTRAWVTPIEQGESIEIDITLNVTTREEIPGYKSVPRLEGETGHKITLLVLKAVADNFDDEVLYKDFKKKMDEIQKLSRPTPSFGMKATAEGEYVDCNVVIELES